MESAANSEKLVLIVEDEHDNREIMRAVVEDLLGYHALAASNGTEALQLAARHMPSLILMDLMMPGLDGFETIRSLKADDATAGIPIIAVTALSRPIDRQKALEYGAEAYLSKPFDLDLMASIVQQYVSLSSVPPSTDGALDADFQVEADHSAAG